MAKSKAKKRGGQVSETTNAERSPIVEDEFGNYRIRAGRLSGNFVARAFPKSSSKSKGMMAEATGASEVEAIEALKFMLGEREAQRTAIRRWDPQCELFVPNEVEFSEALQQSNLSPSQLAMFKAQAIAGEKGLTATALMNAAGYRSQATAIKVFARAGALLSNFLGFEMKEDGPLAADEETRVIAFLQDGGEDKPKIWIMHEELRQAVWATL